MTRKRNQRNRKKPFGGTVILFKGREETFEEVFGKKAVTPAQMTKGIWKFIKKKRLMIKPK